MRLSARAMTHGARHNRRTLHLGRFWLGTPRPTMVRLHFLARGGRPEAPFVVLELVDGVVIPKRLRDPPREAMLDKPRVRALAHRLPLRQHVDAHRPVRQQAPDLSCVNGGYKGAYLDGVLTSLTTMGLSTSSVRDRPRAPRDACHSHCTSRRSMRTRTHVPCAFQYADGPMQSSYMPSDPSAMRHT